VYDLVRAHVAVLGECLAADVAVVWSLAGVPSFVRLEVAQLAKSLAAGGLLAQEWFHASVGARVDVEVGLLVEGFVAARDCALISFSGSGFLRRGGEG